MLSELICSFLTFHLELVLTGPGSLNVHLHVLGKKDWKNNVTPNLVVNNNFKKHTFDTVMFKKK